MREVIAVEKSAAKKITGMSCTYASIELTCPEDCPLRQTKTCYAMHGRVAMHERTIHADSTAAAERAEAEAIRGLSGERDLRLHVSGDTKTNRGAKLLAAAARLFASRHGRSVFTFTHSWRNVKRENWRGVSVLGSCEQAEGLEALAAGYTPAAVVDRFPEGKVSRAHGITWIHCREQTENSTCAECRLCVDLKTTDAMGKRSAGILFQAI